MDIFVAGMPLTFWTILALVLAAGIAGWVDAVVGGGGLIQLPALLIGLPDSASTAEVLGTNKASSVAGTAVALATYLRKIPLHLMTAGPLVACAFAGSAGGASLARYIPKNALPPIVLAALIGVGWYTLRKPQLGLTHSPTHDGWRRTTRAGSIGLAVGLWDGLLGPGTGSFFVIALVAVLGYGFLEASVLAKLANLTTNIASLIVFGISGEVLWLLGGLMACANILGGVLGARTAIAQGSRFVRVVFLVVVGALALKLAWDTALILLS